MTNTDGNFTIPSPTRSMNQTGERMTAGLGGQTEIEHYHRYCLARDLCVGLDVVDIASGEGYGSAMIAGTARSVIGVDVDREAVAHASAAYQCANLQFCVGDALAIPVPAGSADVVVSFETLEHIRDHEGFVREVRRILRPGGKFLVSTPDRIIYSAPGEPINPYHLRELTAVEFDTLLSGHFENRRVWRQRALVGSLIVPDNDPSGSWRSFERRDGLIEASAGFSRGRYILGLASDGELNVAGGSSYFHQINVDLACRALETQPSLKAENVRLSAEAFERDIEIARLRAERLAETMSLETEVARLKAEHLDWTLAVEASLQERLQQIQEIQASEAEALHRFEGLVQDLRTTRAQAALWEGRFRCIESSEMWRMTSPLRSVGTAFPSLARFGRRSLKAIWWTLTFQLGRRLALRNAATLAKAAEPPARALESISQASDLKKKLNNSVPALPTEPNIRLEAVDIIICIHNALDDVRRCLASLLRFTLPPYRLVLVDDGSASATREYLQDFVLEHGATLIRHEEALGYTFAANAGLRAVMAPFCVLLNSDTEVTEGWLDRMMDPMRQDPRVGLVGPMSNTASWQSCPVLFENGQWAENALPAGLASNDMARLLAKGASRRPVSVGFLNGFCLLLRQKMIEEIGVFDDVTFRAGYGEENDYCIRARQAGWLLLVAEDAYVFHNQSSSYGHERRRALAVAADKALAEKHRHETEILPQVILCQRSLQLLAARLRLGANVQREKLVAEGRNRFEGRRIAIILPVATAGGGANVIHQEARAMRDMGVDVWLINVDGFRQSYEASYPGHDFPVLYASPDPHGVYRLLLECGVTFDAVIATAFSSFEWLPSAGPVLGYYIQDLEVRFFEDAKHAHLREIALQSYLTRPEVVRVTKSAWNRDAVLGIGGLAPVVVGPSVNLDAFRPTSDMGLEAGQPVRITAMVRPSTPRRNPDLTYGVLVRLKQRFGPAVEVSCFGGSPQEMAGHGFVAGEVADHGVLTAEDISALLGHSDIFLDFSAWQAMGMTVLEAMASGSAVVAPMAGGTSEFCIDGVSGLIVDTTDEAACLAAAERLVTDEELRLTLRRNGMEVASAFPPERAALNVLTAMFAS